MAKSKDAKDKKNRAPDAFQGMLQKDFSWAVQHRVTIMLVVVALVVIGVAYAGYQQYQQSIEEQAQQLYYKTEDSYMAKIEQQRLEDQAQTGEDEAEFAELEVIDRTKLGNLEDEIRGFNQVIAEYPSSEAAVMAAIQLSQIYVDQRKFDAAIEVLTDVRDSSGSKAFLRSLLLHRLGSVQAKQGDCEAAMTSFETILSQKDFQYLHAEAQLRMGICHEKLGNLEEAKRAYRSASEASPEAGAGQTAVQYLRLLERGAGDS